MQSDKEKAIYNSWANMKQRCRGTSNSETNRNYSSRGITYDQNWDKFDSFYKDMQKGWKKGLTIDRIDNNGNYSKENCRWADRKAQAINRRNTRLFTHLGEEKTLTDWSTTLGIKQSALAQRIYCYKWSIEKTLSTT